MACRESGVKIRASEKDLLIAELRQQLYDLRNQNRDFRGVNDEIFSMENRYRMLSDDKLRSEHDNRGRLDRTADEVGDSRKQLEDLKYLLQEKTREHCDLNNESGRNRVILDEKHREVASLHAENNA